MSTKRLFRLNPVAVMALACLMLSPETLYATTRAEKKTLIAEELTQPTFRTLTVDSCPGDRVRKKGEEWKANTNGCSRARLMYPFYKKTSWMNQLIAQSIILPMFAERLDETPARSGGDALYKDKLISLVRKGGSYGSIEKPPSIDFVAKLAGYEKSPVSPAGLPHPEIFGPYLQFTFTHELNQQYDAHPPGPQGGFIVIDIQARRVLTFDDLILPGKEKALEDLQRMAFHAWLRSERRLPGDAIRMHFTNPAYAFRLNRNWRITEGGLMFRFAIHEIGPRPFGSPEIFVEKERLHNIIHPDILEQIPDRELAAGN